MGNGFAFVARQKHFQIGDSDFFADLILYNIKLHAYVVVELKATPFKPEYAGQLNFYINVVDDKLRGEMITRPSVSYEIRPLSDRAIERACYQHMERYSQEIEAQLDVTRSLSKPLNEANNRNDSIGYREHTAEEEKNCCADIYRQSCLFSGYIEEIHS